MFNEPEEPTPTPAPKPRRRRARTVALVLAALVLTAAGVAHLPPVRAWALDAGLAWANRTFGIVARASGLDYNLFTLRFTLDGPTVAASHTPGTPFFTADRVEVDLPWSWARGDRSLQALRIDGPRIAIAGDASNRFNLPAVKGGRGGGSSLEIGELTLRDISVSLDDRVRKVGLQVQRASLRLAGGAGTLEGRLRMGAPGALQVGDWHTTLTGLAATLTLRGRTLQVSPLTIRTSDGEVSLDGTAGLTPDAPLDVAVGAQVRIGRVVGSLVPGLDVGGTLEVWGHARGTVSEPEARLEVRAPAFTYGRHAPGVLTGSLTATRHALGIDALALDAPWGGVRASGRIADGHRHPAAADRRPGVVTRTPASTVAPAGPNHIDFTWRGIDAATAAAASDVELPFAIAARTGGTGRLEWPAAGGGVALRAAATVTPGAGRGLPVTGSVRVDKSGPRWTIAHDVGGPGGMHARGRVGVDTGPDPVTLSGDIDAESTDLGAALAALASAGVGIAPEVVAAVRGSARAKVTLSGNANVPRFAIDAASPAVSYAPLPDARVEARLVVLPHRVLVDTATAHFAGGSARAADLRIDTARERMSGPVSATLHDIGPIASAYLPELGPVSGSLVAAGQLGGTFGNPRVATSVEAADVTIAGQRFETVVGDVTYAEPRLEWRSVRAHQAEGSLSSTGWYDLDRDEYEIEAAGRTLAIAPCPAATVPCRDGIPIEASVDHLAVSAHGRAGHVTGTVDLGAQSVRWKGLDAGTLVGTASFTDGAGTLELQVPDRGARLAGTVTLPSPSPFDLTLTTIDSTVPDLLRFAGRSDDAARVAGTLSATVRAVGAFDDLDKATFEMSLPPSQLVVDGRRWHMEQAARLAYGPDRVEVSGLTLGIGDSLASLSGGLDRDGRDTMSITVEGALDDFVHAADVRGIEARGHASARLEVSGTPARPLVSGIAEITGAAVTHPKASVSIERLPAALENGMVTVTGAILQIQGARATVDAAVPVTMAREWLPEPVLRALGTPPRGSRATLGATLSGTLADSGLLGNTSLPLAGTLSGRLDLEADALTLEALRGRGTVQSAYVSVGSSRITQATPGVLTIDGGRVTLEPWTLTGAGSNLVASGSLGLSDGSLPLAATLVGPLQLEPLQALLGLPVSGLLTADVRVTGTADAPRANGTIALAGGALRVGSPRIAVADLKGSARLDGTAVVLEGVTGLVNGSPFVVTGSASLPGVASTEPRTLRLVAQRVAIQPFATGPRAEADLDLAYTDINGERTIGGRADLLPQPFRGSVLALKQLADTVASANAPLGGPTRRRKPDSSPIKLNIAVDSTQPMLVDTNAGRVELAARLTVGGSLEQPTLLGRVTVLDDGIIRAGGRTYTVSSGTVDFTNPRRVVPLINLTATTRISTYAITMIVAGTPDALQTSLTSDPPLAESDLRSLIVTGRLASDSARQQGEAASERQVIESISGDIFGFAAQAIGLDAVSIGNPDLDLLGSDIDARTSLNLTKSLSRQLEVVFSRDLQDDRSSWLVIYRPVRSLSLRALSRDNREGAMEFRQEFRFGGSPPPGRTSSGQRQTKPRVTSVSFTGDLGFPETQLYDVLTLTRGARFDTWRWRGETERLARFYRSRGFFTARILPRRQSDGTGVALAYAIARGPRTTLAVDGHELPRQVIERMRDAWADSVSTSFLVEDVETIARTHLVDDGYLAPSVEAEVPVQTKEALAVLLHVRPGPLVQDRAIDVKGASDAMRPTLEAFLQASHLRRSGWYDPASMKAPVEAFYRDRGYLEAKVTPSAVVIDGPRARLQLAIDEGRLHRVGRIAVDGADALGDEKVRAATGVAIDAPWQAAFVAQALTNVEGAYHNAGFADTEVYVEPQIDATAGRVTLYVAVAEGQRQVLQDLAIAGTRVTMTKTVSDLAHLRFGNPVTPSLLSDVQKRLYDVGVFSHVTVDFTPAPGGSHATQPFDDPVIAKVTVTEAPRFSVQYGVQVSRTSEATGTAAEYKPGAAVDFRDRNFLGRALGLGLGVRADSRLQSARATVTMPRTYGTGIRSYLFMDRSREQSTPEAGFSIEDNTASITAEQRWRRSPRLEYSWGLAYDYQQSILSATSPDRELITLTGDTVGPRLAVVFDSRDDPFDTRRGFFHSSGLDLGVRFLGSDQAYARMLVQDFLFVPKGPLVFASGLRYGGLFTWGPDNLIQLDLRFDAGGSRSVRGYGEDTLSSEDFLGVPIGGKQMLVLNEEVRFPIWWWLKGAAFVDAGNTFPSFGQLRLGDLRVGAGWGLRLATPLALIRFDAGYPVNDPTRTKPRYYFSIGQAF